MIPQRAFAVLVGVLAVLVVAFCVLMAFYLLVLALGDVFASRALLGTAFGCLILLVTDLILLVGALGLKSIERRDRHTGD